MTNHGGRVKDESPWSGWKLEVVVNRPPSTVRFTHSMPINANQLNIVIYPNPVLTKLAQPIESVTDEVRSVAARMLQLMHEAPGVGLAGPQVGLSWRLFVANPTGQPDDDQVFINPKVTIVGRATEQHDEGCLSLPEVIAAVSRPKQVIIEAMDDQGQPFSLEGLGLTARIWQHELDHLDGILILSRMTEIDRIANKSVVRNLENQYEEGR